MNKISLVMATVGRVHEVEEFINALKKQKFSNYELIIVDQNTHYLLKEIYEKFKDIMEIKYIRSEKKGLSLNRNIGIQHVTGNIIAFPDDDCEYDEDTLLSVNQYFNNNDKEIYYSKMCDGVYRLLTGLMACLIMFTPIIWKILIRGSYEAAYYQLPVLYLGIMFSCMSSTIGGIYIAHMKTKSVGITTMVAAAINFLIDICFIRWIGIWAGSISTLISYFLLWLYRLIDVQRFQKIYVDKKRIIASIAALVLMSILNFQNTLICNLLNIPVCGIVLWLFDRDIFKAIIMKFLKKKRR